MSPAFKLVTELQSLLEQAKEHLTPAELASLAEPQPDVKCPIDEPDVVLSDGVRVWLR